MGKPPAATERHTSHSSVQTHALIDEVLAEYEHPTTLREGEFTNTGYAQRKGITSYEARGIINRAIRGGKVERVREIWVDGEKVWAFRLKHETND